jgi:hypothetical protein
MTAPCKGKIRHLGSGIYPATMTGQFAMSTGGEYFSIPVLYLWLQTLSSLAGRQTFSYVSLRNNGVSRWNPTRKDARKIADSDDPRKSLSNGCPQHPTRTVRAATTQCLEAGHLAISASLQNCHSKGPRANSGRLPDCNHRSPVCHQHESSVPTSPARIAVGSSRAGLS